MSWCVGNRDETRSIAPGDLLLLADHMSKVLSVPQTPSPAEGQVLKHEAVGTFPCRLEQGPGKAAHYSMEAIRQLETEEWYKIPLI